MSSLLSFVHAAHPVGQGLNVKTLLDDPPADLLNQARLRDKGIAGQDRACSNRWADEGGARPPPSNARARPDQGVDANRVCCDEPENSRGNRLNQAPCLLNRAGARWLTARCGEDLREERMHARAITFAAVLAFGSWMAAPGAAQEAADLNDFKLETGQQLADLCSANEGDPFYTEAMMFCYGVLAEGSEMPDPVKFNKAVAELMTSSL